ncbi:MAG: polyprenyl synthetase family protein [Bacteriovoracaceae bacterium]|nr:polyprenyl synthetase family protein [Bacteriovoracaceae bacterium]
MLAELLKNIPPEITEGVNDLNMHIKSKNCESAINELLGRTVLVGGKRLRPLLTFLMSDLFGVSVPKIMPFAKSIELVHAASLSHDDVVDGATIRRGMPSINIVGSNKKAVLAGDYLLANVMSNLAKEGNIDLVIEMAQVISDLAEGEWLQLDTSESRKYTRQIINEIAIKKTGSVMSFCSIAPAYLAQAPKGLIEHCRQLGINLGLAFQLMDDTLDFSKNAPKNTALDLKNGIVNSVVFEWMQLNPGMQNKYLEGADLGSLVAPDNMLDAIHVVKNMANSLLNESQDILKIISTEIRSYRTQKQVQQALIPIEMIIDFLGKRSY